MTEPTDRYEGIEGIVHISTNVRGKCQECDKPLFDATFQEVVNHYIQEHGYRLLHVGSEFDHDLDGKTIHHTVAVLGK